MLAGENHLFACARLKPSQGSVPAGLTLSSGLRIYFQCQAGSSLVLRRPIEIAALIRHLTYFGIQVDSDAKKEQTLPASRSYAATATPIISPPAAGRAR
jgi:hypothetical protein